MKKTNTKFNTPTATKIAIKGSSAVREMLYNKQNKRLYVTFKNGNQYRIDDVSSDQFAYGRKANSIGRWVNGLCRRQGAEYIK